MNLEYRALHWREEDLKMLRPLVYQDINTNRGDHSRIRRRNKASFVFSFAIRKPKKPGKYLALLNLFKKTKDDKPRNVLGATSHFVSRTSQQCIERQHG